jgi:DNA-binding IclR family transcriptional regulator
LVRPALSASRTAAVLDLLTAFPDRAFKMSEIVQATKINVASCHAVLNALTRSGYLTRIPKRRTYVLGPALVAVGRAALKNQPLIDRAQQAAHELFQDLQVPVLLSTVVNDEILAVTSIADRSGRTVGIRPGQRVPFIPPLGTHFIAWSSEATITAWLARAGAHDEQRVKEWLQTAALIRQRGFHVMLREPEDYPFAKLMSEWAAGQHPTPIKDDTINLITLHRLRQNQLETIAADAQYDVNHIAAPIFDQETELTLSLCLGGFPNTLTGAEIYKLSDQLLRTCLRVMREHRGT